MWYGSCSEGWGGGGGGALMCFRHEVTTNLLKEPKRIG